MGGPTTFGDSFGRARGSPSVIICSCGGLPLCASPFPCPTSVRGGGSPAPLVAGESPPPPCPAPPLSGQVVPLPHLWQGNPLCHNMLLWWSPPPPCMPVLFSHRGVRERGGTHKGEAHRNSTGCCPNPLVMTCSCSPCGWGERGAHPHPLCNGLLLLPLWGGEAPPVGGGKGDTPPPPL